MTQSHTTQTSYLTHILINTIMLPIFTMFTKFLSHVLCLCLCLFKSNNLYKTC